MKTDRSTIPINLNVAEVLNFKGDRLADRGRGADVKGGSFSSTED